jgi:soluble lytic murein transglycosylase
LSAFHSLLIVFLCLAQAVLAVSAHAGDGDLLAARDAYAKGHAQRFERSIARIDSEHPLRAYADYWRMKMNDAGNEAKEAFVTRFADSPLAERVRVDLARDFGARGDWASFDRWATRLTKPDNEIRCLTLRARIESADPEAQQEAVRMYLTGADLPSSCEALFALLSERGQLRPGDRLARLRLALEARNLRLARVLIDALPDEARSARELLARAERDPARLIGEAPAGPAAREVVLYALAQIARNDPQQAADFWERQREAYNAMEQQYGWAQIATQATRQLHPKAVEWYLKVPGQLSETQAIWHARAMLRAGRWPDVYRGIMAMPDTMQEEPIWRYWKARALKQFGAHVPANALFARLSREINYYGVLAGEELPVRMESATQDYRPGVEELRAMRALPGIDRALRLRRLGLINEATTEWQWALRGMNDPQLLAAAEVARQESWNDRAINTADMTRDTHNFDLRYLTPYRDLAEAYSRAQGLDPAWVFGLMRQESRFVDFARSSAGAVGLMQIMPATARWIGNQMGDRRAHAAVREPETNIRFGTFYLKNIYTRLAASPVLATAGYNAGPGRARRWQAATPLEGAIYVESIPITETREYVKKVLTNAIFYSQRLGTPSTNLKDRLGIIPARGNADDGNGPDAPDV